MIHFVWDEMPISNFIISLALLLLLEAAVFYVFLRVVKRRIPLITVSILLSLNVISFLFAIFYVFVISSVCTGATVAASIVLNQGDFNKFLSNPFSKVVAKNVYMGVEKIFDRNAMYETIDEAVQKLSATRTGAIITFERNKSLKDIIIHGNGVKVNSPVSAELLETIFYPGTRLHDGAVVISGDKIAAAAVFFEPTKKIFASKYGSRHRAAIGISEVSDAVTVVVSEETGRISFAINGQIEPVEPNNFLNAFKTYMADEAE